MFKHLSIFSFSVLSICVCQKVQAQVTGGQEAFEYLKMSNSPYASALGGVVPMSFTNDVSLGVQNPALYRPAMHNQLSASYNNYYAGINIANLQYSYTPPNKGTTFGIGFQYLNYGSMQRTDIYGNANGNFKPSDFALNISASRKYLNHWRYGITAKYAYSNLGEGSAMGLLADVGIVYVDTTNRITFGAVAKNMGFMLKKYSTSAGSEPLPFDMQLGISKQLKNVPLRVFAVAHHLYQWDVRYFSPEDRVNSSLLGDTTVDNGKHTLDKIFRHLNFGAELLLGSRITLTAAYSHIRRKELGVPAKTGMAGFSFGAGVDLTKLQINFARSYVASAGAYNEIGIRFNLYNWFGVGKNNESWGWNQKFDNWQ